MPALLESANRVRCAVGRRQHAAGPKSAHRARIQRWHVDCHVRADFGRSIVINAKYVVCFGSVILLGLCSVGCSGDDGGAAGHAGSGAKTGFGGSSSGGAGRQGATGGSGGSVASGGGGAGRGAAGGVRYYSTCAVSGPRAAGSGL